MIGTYLPTILPKKKKRLVKSLETYRYRYSDQPPFVWPTLFGTRFQLGRSRTLSIASLPVLPRVSSSSPPPSSGALLAQFLLRGRGGGHNVSKDR